MDRDQELALVGRLRARDPDAFDEVYEAFRPRLFGYLLRLTQRRDVADDLLEETWMRLVIHATRLRPDTRLAPWLFTVARRLFWSFRRSRGLGDHVLVDVDAARSLADGAPSPYDITLADERTARVERALAMLPASDRDVLLLMADGLSPSEAASVCSLRPEAFRQRLSRARTRLCRHLEQAPAPWSHAPMTHGEVRG